MAMFHLSTKTISRKTGRTATASAAYRAGEKIECERTGLVHDYTRKSGVMASSAFMFDGDKKITLDRQDLWNTAEKSEKRKDARTAREIVVNLPHELNHEQRKALVDDFTKSLAKGLGIAIDYAIHEPNRKGDDRNYHAHIMMTTRTATMENGVLSLGAKSNIELENKALKAKGLPSTQEQITSIRKDWADYTNHHLRKAGLDISIDHRSHAARGLIKAPTIKMGVAVTAMERRGIKTDKGDINREIRRGNDEIYDLCERQWAENHPYYIAPAPAPAPKPAPKPAPEPEPEPAPPPPAPKPAPPPPPPPEPEPEPAPAPAPVIVRLPVTSSYIPNGQYLYQRPTIAIGQYIGCRGFQSVDAHLGQISVDLTTMQVVKENVTSAYPEKLRDEFLQQIKKHAAEFLGVDEHGNERMGFDKYNEYLQQKHGTTFRAHESYHAELIKVINYEQQQMQQQPQQQQHDSSYDYDLGM